MKKYIVGFLVGAFFTVSATAFADDIQSLIGKTVQAQYTVAIGDQTLSTIVVEGKNYASVRSIGEAAGYSVEVEGKNVIFKKEESEIVNQDNAPVVSTPRITQPLTKEQIEEAIKSAQDKVERYSQAVATSEEAIKKETDQSKIAEFTVFLNLYKQQLADAKSLVTKFQAQLAELQK